MLLTTRMVAKIVRPDIALGSAVRTEGVATFHQRVGHFSAKHFSLPYWRHQFSRGTASLTGEQEGDPVNQSPSLIPADVSIPAEKTKEPASPRFPSIRGHATPVLRSRQLFAPSNEEIRAPTPEEGGRSALVSLPLATLRERRRERTIRRLPPVLY